MRGLATTSRSPNPPPTPSYYVDTPRPSPRTIWTRRVPHPAWDDEQGRALLAGLHLVGVSLVHGPAAEALDRAACGQRGLSFVAAVPPDGSPLADCGVQPRTVTTTDARVPAAPVDTRLLLNASDLPRLSALPLAPAPPVAWGTPRLLPGARTAVALSRAVFDRRAGANAPPRLTGAVGVDFLLDDVLRAVRDLERPRGVEVRAPAGRASSFRRFVRSSHTKLRTPFPAAPPL